MEETADKVSIHLEFVQYNKRKNEKENLPNRRTTLGKFERQACVRKGSGDVPAFIVIT